MHRDWGKIEIFGKCIFMKGNKKQGQCNECEKLASIKINNPLTKFKQKTPLKFKMCT